MASKTKTATPVKDDEKTEEAAPETVSVKELAERVGTDPKSFRRWLRKQTNDRANKGGRWAFTHEAADALEAAYKKPKEAKTETTAE